MRIANGALLAGWFVIAGLAPVPLAAADLAPHRAIYAMSLHSTKPASGIAGASGAMNYTFSDTCDGWTVENRTVLNFAYNEGDQVATTWEFVTWESKDGLRYRFHVKSTRDGTVVEEIDGSANLEGKGKGGQAVFTQPKEMTVELPQGTLFPTEHTLRAIEQAEAAERFFNRVVFDGSGTDGPFEVSAVIGNKLPAGNDKDGSSSLTAVPSWPMQMAFFPIASTEPFPDYEVALRYFGNGVATDVIQNFGNFALRGKLEKLEPLPKPDC